MWRLVVLGFVLLACNHKRVAGFPAFLVKTTETFKLADLQDLEARLQIPSCQRVLVDAATGSSLLRIDDGDVANNLRWPSSLQRSDWVGEILAESDDVQKFVTEVRGIDMDDVTPDGWILEYLRLQTRKSIKTKTNYTSRTLMMCVAQAIPVSAQLFPQNATETLLIVDTVDRQFLLRLMPNLEEASSFITAWSQRPFQYSSAINQNAAEIITDLLLHMVQQGGRNTSNFKLLDPTCGSGTFLACALDRGMNAEGWDVNQACVDGTKENLINFLGQSSLTWDVTRCNAAEFGGAGNSTEHLESVDCVVANLPWGQNTIAYKDENTHILQHLGTSLRSFTPCVFVTKDETLLEDMKHLDYDILGTAHIPQQNFELPKGKKSKNKNGKVGKKGTTNCVITVVMSPSKSDDR